MRKRGERYGVVMSHPPLDLAAVRSRFPGLARRGGDRTAVFFDGPAGSQVPASVAAAMSHYLLHTNANHGGCFAPSVETDEATAAARRAAALWFGADDAEEVVFGANMTTLTFHLARALARTWRPGEEVVVTDSDHDANVMPWVLAARDAGCHVQRIAVRPDTTLDLDDARRKIGPKTRLCAVGAASNLSGTIHPVAEIAELAARHGALTFVDAVHSAPHLCTDVRAWGADFVACSAYKFFGPHLGLLWGRRALLEELETYKVRPAPAHGAEKWQTGTANFEAIVGTHAAIEYVAELGDHGRSTPAHDRRSALRAAFGRIGAHEQALAARLLDGLARLPDVRVVGLADPAQVARRCATVSLVAGRRPPAELARELADRHVHCWAGNSYAVALSQALGLEPHGVLRLGMLHYNTADEVDHVLHLLGELLG